jgi:hypothetical protein
MANILISYRAFPITIGRYFKDALKELGHTVWHVGSYSDTIPWNPNRNYDAYLDIPDYITPDDMPSWIAADAVANCPFTPDAFLDVRGGSHRKMRKYGRIMPERPSRVNLPDRHAP